MGILSWILFGLLVGFVARAVIPGDDPMGWIFTVLVGIGGSVLGGFLGTQLGYGSISGFDMRSLAMAVGGACLLLLVRRTFIARPVV